MHKDFWHERWSTNQIAFHESEANPLLVAHFAALGLPKGARVFVPLCGKTLDIDWLLAQGYHVVGAELSPLAVTQLFERLGVTPQLTRVGELERRSVPALDLFVGDFFALTPELLGTVDAVYDRAALIALPSDLRGKYAAHLSALTHGVPQLLVAVEYDPQQMAGPPFPVTGEEIRSLYADSHFDLLASQPVSGGLKGRCAGTENVWLGR
jgi:thiopurine S-methyltransferase